ncbi:hypothetical protein KF728_29525 [Candidatus Obscuribacterales bacterium]|nr:hypothetical protein [Candidatus Obscuribacterales bacterium]
MDPLNQIESGIANIEKQSLAQNPSTTRHYSGPQAQSLVSGGFFIAASSGTRLFIVCAAYWNALW